MAVLRLARPPVVPLATGRSPLPSPPLAAFLLALGGRDRRGHRSAEALSSSHLLHTVPVAGPDRLPRGRAHIMGVWSRHDREGRLACVTGPEQWHPVRPEPASRR